jgi:hypothetical protein
MRRQIVGHCAGVKLNANTPVQQSQRTMMRCSPYGRG